MLQLTYAQILLGIVGAVGLLLTIWFTRKALQQSREAFEHARKIDQQDRRAWLVVSPALLGDFEVNNPRFGIKVELEIRNIGNVPAVEVRYAGKLFVSDGEGDQPTRLDSFWIDSLNSQMVDRIRGSIILPDQPLRVTFFARGEPAEFAGSKLFQAAGGAPIGLFLCVTYTSGSETGRYVTSVGYWLSHNQESLSLFSNQPSTVTGAELSLVQFEGGFAS